MKRTISLMAVVAAAGSLACAGLRPGERADPAANLELGLQALAAGDRAAANEHLYPLFRHFPDRAVGQRALLALLAAEIDPRHEERRLWWTADMASAYLQQPDIADWTVPIAQTFYLLSLELGAAEQRIAEAEAEAAAASRLPELTRPTVPARLATLESERETLRRRVQQLEQQLAQRERDLREREQEIERIRRTIRG